MFIIGYIKAFLFFKNRKFAKSQGLDAKPATPKDVRHSISLHAFNSATPLPQLRKINRTLQNALVEKAAWWAAMCYAGLRLKTPPTH
jgi:hypothetical protein